MRNIAYKGGAAQVKHPLFDDVNVLVGEGDKQLCVDVDGLAKIITKQISFAQDKGQRLYFYKNGVYQPDGDRCVTALVKQIQTHFGKVSKWKTKTLRELIAYIRADAPLLWERPPLDGINLQNGILDLRALVLKQHTDDFLSTLQLPVKYDPEARCPAWEEFVAQTFPLDAQVVAWEIVAWLMVPHTGLQKALLLLGPGGNGKSTFLRGLGAFLGPENVASMSLHKLESERFASTRLLGKLANICPDLPNRKLETASVFKAITGEDPVMMEYKFGDTIDAHPFCRLVFSANEIPRCNDSSDGFYRRWIILPFTKTFDVNPEIGEKLSSALADPKELSGVLNNALEVLPNVMRRGITVAPSMQEALDTYQRFTDPIAVWLDVETESDPEASLSKSVLRDAYNADRAARGEVPITEQAFGRAVKKLRPDLKEAQRTVAGKVTWVHNGLRFRKDSIHGLH
jgi:putative DNA primase/helicase